MYQQFWQFLVFLQSTGIFNVVAVLAVAMIFDFFSGMLVATWTKTISSRIGINGIIRKLASMFLLLFLYLWLLFCLLVRELQCYGFFI